MAGEHKKTLKGHTGDVFSVSFSPDGQTIASGSSDNTIRLWDVVAGEHKKTLKGHTGDVFSVSFSPDGQTIASGSSDNTIRLWDAVAGEHKKTLKGHTDWVRSVSFSPDGQTIASGSSDNTIRLWDVVAGEHKKTLKGHTRDVFSVSFSPDGQTIASGSRDGTMLLWHATSTLDPRAVDPTGKQTTTWGKLKTTTVFQNYPNPFNPETWVPYQLETAGAVTLRIYGIEGNLIRTLRLGNQAAGLYESKSRAVYWNGRNEQGEPVSSGLYFYTLTVGDFTATRRMLLRK